MTLTLIYRDATNFVCVALVSLETGTDRVVVDGVAFCIGATCTRARVDALKVATSLVTQAVSINNTLGTALSVGVTVVITDTLALVGVAFPLTLSIEATGRWGAWIIWCHRCWRNHASCNTSIVRKTQTSVSLMNHGIMNL